MARRAPTLALWRLLCWCGLWLATAATAATAGVLALPGATAGGPERLDAWPVVRLLEESDGALGLAQARDRAGALRPVDTPHANLGVRRHGVWLQWSLQVPADADPHWVLDINYPSLDRVEVYLLADGALRQSALMGDHLPAAQRPLRGRTHALMLDLLPGRPHELWLRVETTSSMILPLQLMTREALAEREAGVQVLQGLAAGIGLCLVIYALAYWWALREATFALYALSAGSITLFFFALEGLGPQHLWGGSTWLTRNAAPFAVLWALVGGLQFLEHTLSVRQLMPRVGQAMLAAAALAGLAALAFVLGLIDYRQAQLAATLLGPSPIVLGLPAAWRRARLGDRAAIYIVIGWGVYAIGIAVMALLLRGRLDATPWTLHAFQAGALFEMVMWMRVLGVRVEDLRADAERGHREREFLRSLADTDALTGLLNRRGLERALKAMLPRAAPGQLLALYVLDLDGFKAVNDQWGHEAGDTLLRALAGRLRACVREGDQVARVGGDEFVVLVCGLAGDDEAARVGDKLLASVNAPFEAAGRALRLGLTVGYALAPEDGVDGDQLLQQADAAMYRGKQAGKQCLRRAAPVQG